MHSSIAHFTDAAFRLVTEWTGSRSLMDLPYHRMHSGAASMIRQSGNLLDIASAICSRSNCALRVFNQHRALSLTQGLCRTANTCKAGLIVGALRIACNGLCTAARFHSAGENSGCLFGCKDRIALGITLNVLLCSGPFSLPALATVHVSLSAAIFNDQLFKIA